MSFESFDSSNSIRIITLRMDISDTHIFGSFVDVDTLLSPDLSHLSKKLCFM